MQVAAPPIQSAPLDEVELFNRARNMDQASFHQLLEQLADHYHNGVGVIDDRVFDDLIDIYESKFGEYKEVGALPRGQRVTLPYYMSGLKKIKKEAELTSWLQKCKGPYVLQDKIDGLTLLYVLSKGENKLYTRGRNGIGMDVSHMFQHLNLPKVTEDIAVRGEIVMDKAAFQKYGQGFKNARNMVSGIVNAKDSYNPILAKEMKFIAYQIMGSKDTPEQQVLKLQKLGFTIPWAATSPTLSMTLLENQLQTRKNNAPYEMDGLVIYQNENIEYPTSGLPTHIIAFKMQSEICETVVTAVIWEASKDRLLKPVIQYQPVVLSGATLQRTNGDNARYIITNGIGPGAKIVITRSGDVIPRIVTVLQPAQPSLPDPKEHGAYSWNQNGVELVLLEDNNQVLAAKIEHFLDKLEVKNIGPGRVKVMVGAGLNSIHKVLTATPEQLATIDRIGTNLAQSMCQEIRTKTQNVPLARIMGACGIFPGIGEKRFVSILEQYPMLIYWCKSDPAQIEQALSQVKGIKKLAHEIAIRLSSFYDWLVAHPMITIEYPKMPQPKGTLLTVVKDAPQVPQNLANQVIVFSGFRDKDLEAQIQARGGRVTTSVSRNTTLLVMKDLSEGKSKTEKAIQLGVRIISKDDFVRQFMN